MFAMGHLISINRLHLKAQDSYPENNQKYQQKLIKIQSIAKTKKRPHETSVKKMAGFWRLYIIEIKLFSNWF
jgi:hypothetical protein